MVSDVVLVQQYAVTFVKRGEMLGQSVVKVRKCQCIRRYSDSESRVASGLFFFIHASRNDLETVVEEMDPADIASERGTASAIAFWAEAVRPDNTPHPEDSSGRSPDQCPKKAMPFMGYMQIGPSNILCW